MSKMIARSENDMQHDPLIDILCIGETMVLVSPLGGAALSSAKDFSMSIAGAESNVALYATDLGLRCSWASRVGTDPFGSRITDYLSASDVDIDLTIRDTNLQTGVFFKDPSPAGSSVYYYRRGSAASKMSPSDLAEFALEDARIVHTTGVLPALSPSCLDMARTLSAQLNGSSTLLSFDVNYRAGLWSVAEAAPVLRELCLSSDLVFVGRDEAAMLWGTSDPQSISDFLGHNLHLVVKDAEVGATVFETGFPPVFHPSPRVEVIEPVGAGDAFAAGYLSGLLRGLGSMERLGMGHRVAGFALSSTADHIDASSLR